jgi:hypothetical protein
VRIVGFKATAFKLHSARTVESQGRRDGRIANRLLPMILASSLVSSCGPGIEENAEKKSREDLAKKRDVARKAEAQLMADPAAAATELARRLAEHVDIKSEFIVVRTTTVAVPSPILKPSRDFTITALPATSSWMVKCSRSGIEVTFGGASEGEIAEGAGSIGSAATVALTNTQMQEAQCRTLVMRLSESISRLMKHKQ